MFQTLSFITPYILGFLAALPAIWWLLRVTPPAPKRVTFPALMLLRGLAANESTPARTPLWLLLLRLVIAALIIIAAAGPVLNAVPATEHKGDVLIAVDNDWAAAHDWNLRADAMADIIRTAARAKQNVIILPTAAKPGEIKIAATAPLPASAAETFAAHITPQPWSADYRAAAATLGTINSSYVGEVYWLASGVGGSAPEEFYAALKKNGAVKVLGSDAPILTLSTEATPEGDNQIVLRRASADKGASYTLVARSASDEIIANIPVEFNAGSPRAVADMSALPLELRNQIARFDVANVIGAGTTLLLDSSWGRSPIGIVGDSEERERHSLLSGLTYLDRAIKPFAESRLGSLAALLTQNLSLIIMDGGPMADADATALLSWVKKGGVFVRFADGNITDPSMAQDEIALLPTPLRSGDRALGGALSWAEPQRLAQFKGAFRDLPLPGDVMIQRQILAEPDAALDKKTWAALADGTPLVTAANIGTGISILFHVPANATWSNLPLSGAFPAMLRRIADMPRRAAHDAPPATGALPAQSVMDGFGDLHAPQSAIAPLNADDLAHAVPDAHHPPGLYGTEGMARAFNLGTAIGMPAALENVSFEPLQQPHAESDLAPFFLLTAFILLLLDFIISLYLRGLLLLRPIGTLALFIALLASTSAHAASAQNEIELTGKTWLGYIRTGDSTTDRTSELGLRGLAAIVASRTSVENLGVAEVNPERDDLDFYPLLYWPLTVAQTPLSAAASERVNDYMRHGGMILFDTESGEGALPPNVKKALSAIALPALVPLPADHVLRRSFYLLDEFPGRHDAHDFWLNPTDAATHDGVSSVLLGQNAYAAAWAMDDTGRYLYPCMPGGEAQREQALRFGINVVMYALTGNYKSDQMHLDALMKKLGK